jgi:hypothetical protein
MPTARGGYFLASGERVPSVTTVISKWKDCGGLVHWSWGLGMQGLDYRIVKAEAADAGSMAHAAVDAWIRQKPYSFTGPPDTVQKAKTAFDGFLRWAESSRLKPTYTEVPLTSETHRYGGTFDAVSIGDTRCVLDWKSSNAIYGEYLVQLAAYGQLWDENNPWDKIDGGFHLLRFDKAFEGDFHHHHWPELDKAWRAFVLLRELYDIDKELKARAK